MSPLLHSLLTQFPFLLNFTECCRYSALAKLKLDMLAGFLKGKPEDRFYIEEYEDAINDDENLTAISEIIDLARKGLALDPEHPASNFVLGKIYYLKRDEDIMKAKEFLEKACQLPKPTLRSPEKANPKANPNPTNTNIAKPTPKPQPEKGAEKQTIKSKKQSQLKRMTPELPEREEALVSHHKEPIPKTETVADLESPDQVELGPNEVSLTAFI